MRLHAYYILALLVVAVLFADRGKAADCGKWTPNISAVVNSWAAAQVCDDPGWKKGGSLLNVLSMGSVISMYPWDEIRDPECIAFIQQTAKDGAKGYAEDQQACDRANGFLKVPSIRNRLLMLGLLN